MYAIVTEYTATNRMIRKQKDRMIEGYESFGSYSRNDKNYIAVKYG